MWRTLLLACLTCLLASPTFAQADPMIRDWQACRGALAEGAAAPVLWDCRPMTSRIIDPQGRELWLRSAIRPPTGKEPGPSALFIAGTTSSQVWFNGQMIGANGQPGPTAGTEVPGRYTARIPIPDLAWRADGNDLVVRLSAFHTGMRFHAPVGGIWIGPLTLRAPAYLLAITFTAAGALAAAAFGFAAIFAMRRTGSSLTLVAMAGVAALQASVETIRSFVNYPYPFHVWRVGSIWILAAAFALLLVAFAAQRFTPRRRGILLAMTGAAILAASWSPGFDEKTAWTLMAGVVAAAVAAAVGVRDRRPGARPVLAYLLVFCAIAVASPMWLLDLSFFILAASLTLPLLVVEVLRLGRDDREREVALTRAASRPDRLTVTTARGVHLTPLKDIVAILGADDYAELRLAGGRSLLHSARLDQLEAQLPASFLRIHRSVIANLSHVERLERDGGRWRLHMSEGEPLPVSRARLATLRDGLDPGPLPMRATA